jgi:hypothetical protein
MILTAVGIAIIDVAKVKYSLELISKPTVNMWCPHTMHPSNAIMNKATNIASLENIIE